MGTLAHVRHGVRELKKKSKSPFHSSVEHVSQQERVSSTNEAIFSGFGSTPERAVHCPGHNLHPVGLKFVEKHFHCFRGERYDTLAQGKGRWLNIECFSLFVCFFSFYFAG